MIRIGPWALDPGDPAAAAALGAAALALVLLALLIVAVRRAGRAARAATTLAERVRALDEGQSRLAGAQTQSAQALEGALAGSAARTSESLGALQQRLAAIDRAQANIEKLSGDVLGLQDILSNRQTRGAFGEIQLHEILSRALPPDAWRWQASLPNGKRADCIVDLPDPPGPMVIDAKFPLDAYERLVAAETDRDRADAARDLRTAVRRHIRTISEKYIVEGATADSALMFLPSEAVYAELHARFGDIVREGFAARVWIVSPTTCMALLNTLRAVLKDVRLRQEAASIRSTLRLLHRDVELVAERADKLAAHFGQVQEDLQGIDTAARRAAGRADRLETLDFEPEGTPPERAVSIIRR